MKKYLLLPLMLLCLSIQSYAQFNNGVIALQDSSSVGYVIVQSKDGGHILAGSTSNFGAGSQDAYVVKFDTNGSLAWAKTLGGPGFDRFVAMANTPDGGVVAVGYTSSFGAGHYDVYAAKFDAAGNVKWTRTIGDTTDNFGYSVLATADSGYLIGGSTGTVNSAGLSQCYLIKLDSLGNVNWVKTLANKKYGISASSVQPCGKGYMVAGNNGGNPGACNIIKVDSKGNEIWSREIFDITSSLNFTNVPKMVQLKNGNYAIASTGYYSIASFELALFVIDSNCNILAEQSYPAGNDFEIWVNGITATNDGGFMITGGSDDPQDYHSAGNMYFGEYDVNTNAVNGSGVSGLVYNFEPVYSASGNCVVQDKDGGYSLGYSAEFSFMYLKVDNRYNSCATGGGSGAGTGSYANDSVAVSNDSIVSPVITTGAGGIEGNGGKELTLCRVIGIETINASTVNVNVYPNPGNGKFNCQFGSKNFVSGEYHIDVYNMLGENIIPQMVINTSQFSIDLSGQPAGVYMYRMLTHTGSLVARRKLVIEK
ncbi:MAG TPA: T9SS type A sorting domain-containing protein [Bacteroidia bacterium]|nr:T9SS type A sorting domain-containing protein [Bacteroidia bacterium]